MHKAVDEISTRVSTIVDTRVDQYIRAVCYIIYLTLIMFKLICFALLSLVAATPITPTPTPEAEKVLAALVS